MHRSAVRTGARTCTCLKGTAGSFACFASERKPRSLRFAFLRISLAKRDVCSFADSKAFLANKRWSLTLRALAGFARETEEKAGLSKRRAKRFPVLGVAREFKSLLYRGGGLRPGTALPSAAAAPTWVFQIVQRSCAQRFG